MSTRVVARALRDDPPGAPVKHQRWHDVVLMHWSVPAASLRPLVPLPLDTYLGQAWLSIVVAEIEETRSLQLPRLLGARRFLQVGIRTYVSADNKPGVFYISLHVDNPLVAFVGRHLSGLPTQRAFGNVDRRGSATIFHCQCADGLFELGTRFIPKDGIYTPAPGSLPFFLCERYYIYSSGHEGFIYRRKINNRPWPLQSASAEITVRGVPEPVQLPRVAPLLHYCHGIDVRFWPRERLADRRPAALAEHYQRGQRLF